MTTYGFALLIFFVPALAWSQPCAVIKGVVADRETDLTLPGANIRSLLLSSGGSTNENGEFEIPYQKGDTLIFTFIGYQRALWVVDSMTGCTATITLASHPNEIRTIEISSEKIIAEEFTFRKIRKLEIYTNPAAKADPILAVNSLPSATTTDESANISLRGGSPAETGIFLNNVPINDAVRYSQLNGIGTFSIFNTALVNNVQVYPGNPPLEYGNSTSGLIALQTDENIPVRSQSSLSLTLASVGMFSSRKLSQNASLTVFANYQPSALIRALNHHSLKNLKSFSSADFGVHYFQKIGKRTTIKIFNYSLDESYEFRHEQPTYDGTFYQYKTRNFTVANFRKLISEKTALTFNQGISFSKADYLYGITDINLRLKDLFSSVNIHHISNASEWKTGLSYDTKRSIFDGAFPTFEFAAGQHHPITSASADHYVANPEWFGYFKHFFGRKWIAGVGARKNIPVHGNQDYFSYQGNVNFKAKDQLTFNFSAGKYFKYHLPESEAQNASLTKSNQLSADVNLFNGQNETSLSLFYKNGTNTSGDSEIKGIEVFNKYRLTRNLQFQLSLTSLHAVQLLEKRSIPSPYNIHYFIRGNLEYKINGVWTITSVFLFRQGSYFYDVTAAIYNSDLQAYKPIYADNPDRLPGYNTIDLSLSRIFPVGKKIIAVAFLSVGNVFNFKNVRSYTYNYDYAFRKQDLFSQRTVYFGLVLNF